MKLIIGLGNPSKKFDNTRHNIGFDAIDGLCQKHNIKLSNKHKSLFAKEKGFIIAKPQTFMNLSGEAVAEIINFYKINIKDIIILYDDVSLEFGQIRTKASGSDGGQKGMKNIIKLLDTNQFWRTRLGVGNNSNYDLADWVLSKFTTQEGKIKKEIINKAINIIELFIENKTSEIMNRYN